MLELEVTHLSTVPIDPALFEVPANFSRVELIRQEPVPPLVIRLKRRTSASSTARASSRDAVTSNAQRRDECDERREAPAQLPYARHGRPCVDTNGVRHKNPNVPIQTFVSNRCTRIGEQPLYSDRSRCTAVLWRML